MPVYRNEVRLNYTSGLPEDLAVNTFHFADTGGGYDADEVFDDLEAFYNVAHSPASNPLAYFIGPIVSRVASACEMFCYEVGVTGPPLHYRAWTLGAAQTGQKQLPYEVALCLSYQGSAPGLPSARQRGRIYLGPLQENALQASGVPPSPTSTLRDAAVGAASWLAGENDVDRSWCIWSRVSQVATPISHGWLDNEFDTQRRRQKEATTRTAWTPAP